MHWPGLTVVTGHAGSRSLNILVHRCKPPTTPPACRRRDGVYSVKVAAKLWLAATAAGLIYTWYDVGTAVYIMVNSTGLS